MYLEAEQHDPHGTALRPPRFTLRTLLLTMTALCCLFAVMSAVGMVGSAVLVLFLCLIAGHVLGNSVGTRLRDQASRQIAVEQAVRPPPPAVPVRLDVAAPRQLTQRVRLKRIALLVTIAGATIGAQFGGLGLAAIHPHSSLAAVALGVFSSAVLGGFAGFLASSFLSVVQQALAEAHRGAAPASGQTILVKQR
jgi:hypothetical protein